MLLRSTPEPDVEIGPNRYRIWLDVKADCWRLRSGPCEFKPDSKEYCFFEGTVKDNQFKLRCTYSNAAIAETIKDDKGDIGSYEDVEYRARYKKSVWRVGSQIYCIRESKGMFFYRRRDIRMNDRLVTSLVYKGCKNLGFEGVLKKYVIEPQDILLVVIANLIENSNEDKNC